MALGIGDGTSGNVDVTLGTVMGEGSERHTAFMVHFGSLFKVLLSILHLNTIIAPKSHF